MNVNAIAGMLEKMQRKMTVSMIFLIFIKKMMKKKKHNATKKPTPQMQKEKCKSP